MTCRVILFLLLTATVSAAHSWYPFECCSGYDCHPIECHELTTLDDQRVLYSPGPKTVIEFPPPRQSVHRLTATATSVLSRLTALHTAFSFALPLDNDLGWVLGRRGVLN